MKKVFLDANMLIDILDAKRPFSQESAWVFEFLVRGVVICLLQSIILRLSL